MAHIYEILNTNTNKRHIGSSIQVKSRISNHKWLLKNGRHPNQELQKSYNDDSGYFRFEIIEETTSDSLIEREQYWINFYWPNCYNKLKTAGPAWTEEKHKVLLQTRFEKNESYGTNSVLTETQVKEIIVKINNGILHKVIAKEYGVAINSISNIQQGASWKHLHHLVTLDLDNKELRLKSKDYAFELFKQGKPRKEVQMLTGRSKATIHRYYHEFVNKNK